MSLDVSLRCDCCGTEVYEWCGMTHNMTPMAREAGCQDAVWYPEENGINAAGDLIVILDLAISRMEHDPTHFRTFNPSNGWGDYDGFLKFLKDYLQACRRYPSAKVEASR